ncbi:MAG: DUF1284 domain-containing protein [Anaerolineae bacterium]|nr:DUF1284 domain-containing protein [Anaerolineae bacterium]
MKLRPHHLIDIISDYGHGVKFTPHPYGHALHTVAEQVLNDLSLEIEFVLAADEICYPCRHLQPNGVCDDVLSQLDEPVSKQGYNDELDGKLFPYLGIKPGARLTLRQFLECVARHFPGIEKICTHPGEQEAYRRQGLEAGLSKLGKEN